MTKLQLKVTSRKDKDEQLKDVAELAVQFIKGDKGEKGDTGEKGDQGPAGVDGAKGDTGANGVDGKDGRDGSDGKNGKDGRDGKKGEKGDQGPAGKDGVSPKIEEVVIDYKQVINAPKVEEIIRVATQSSKTVSLSELDDVDLSGLTKTDGKYVLTPGGSSAETFESVSSNLKDWDSHTIPPTYSVDGDILTITYVSGVQQIVKTFTYTSGDITQVVLSGDTPAGINLVKNIYYTASGDYDGVTYS
jgi:hypothetical protein